MCKMRMFTISQIVINTETDEVKYKIENTEVDMNSVQYEF